MIWQNYNYVNVLIDDLNFFFSQFVIDIINQNTYSGYHVL